MSAPIDQLATDQQWMQRALALAARGQYTTRPNPAVGCVIVKDKRILVTGYVGAPAGVQHCDEAGHEMHTVIHEDGSQSKHCIRTTHAEQNAIANAAREGVPVNGATLYCHMTPCYTCAKILINSGIVRVVSAKDYHASKRSKEVFKEAGVKLDVLNEEVEVYKNMKQKYKKPSEIYSDGFLYT